jgi:hypothetical protein
MSVRWNELLGKHSPELPRECTNEQGNTNTRDESADGNNAVAPIPQALLREKAWPEERVGWITHGFATPTINARASAADGLETKNDDCKPCEHTRDPSSHQDYNCCAREDL